MLVAFNLIPFENENKITENNNKLVQIIIKNNLPMKSSLRAKMFAIESLNKLL